MNKIVAYVVSLTKLGKVIVPVQKFLSGKKAYMAGASLVVPALLIMIQNFADYGVEYLMRLPSTEEFRTFLEGIGIMGLRAAVTKAANPAKDPNASVQ